MDCRQSYGYPPTGQEPARGDKDGRLRLLASLVMVAFAVTLAVVIGQRLSDQAVAVLTGAVCGVGASIPTSLLIVWVTRQREKQQPVQPASPYPPVVVVQPPAQLGASTNQGGYLPPYAPPARREFTVVGGEVEEVIYGHRQ